MILEISSKFHNYSVEVMDTLEQALLVASNNTNTFYLVDSNLLRLYPEPLKMIGNPSRIFSIEATEEQKSFEKLTPLFCWLLQSGFKRNCTLVVMGGGVVQDIGCFISSVLFRGVRWELIPTTLLAQCDSCIGSKSSINIDNYKNQIGTFYPPHKVYMVFGVLDTLPPDEIRSGLGEIIKLNLLAGELETTRLKENLQRFPEDKTVIQKMVIDALQIKKKFIEVDEFDQGIRNILNYGHTFGHAYESATDYGIPHGIAVTLGIVTATFFSEQLGMLPQGYFEELNSFLYPYYHPYEQLLSTTDSEVVLGAMKLDKKNTGISVNSILTRGTGAMEKVSLEMDSQVRPLLKEFLDKIVCV
jgi:3-dehydroquinate synthase